MADMLSIVTLAPHRYMYCTPAVACALSCVEMGKVGFWSPQNEWIQQSAGNIVLSVAQAACIVEGIDILWYIFVAQTKVWSTERESERDTIFSHHLGVFISL